MAQKMDDIHDALSCPACRAIDQADGVEDGRLYPVVAPRVGNEGRLVESFKRAQDRAADSVTGFAGSLNFVYLHAGWFVLWILINVGLVGLHKFDPFPFGFLTMIVSLEAIFLSTFVMVSQNRQGARESIRAEIDFENNVRAEIWSVHIGHALGISTDHVESIVRQTIDGYRGEAGLGGFSDDPPVGDDIDHKHMSV